MEEITVEGDAEGYVELFKRYGVDYIFSSPGTEFVPLWEYLAKYYSQGKKPFYVNTRHETVSLTMAKGYAMPPGGQVVLTHVLVGLLRARWSSGSSTPTTCPWASSWGRLDP